MATPMPRRKGARKCLQCVSRAAPPEGSRRLPPGRRPRLLLGRFLLGSLYRHKGYWHARVRDLVTGRAFRMSSGEKNKRKAEGALSVRLTMLADGDDDGRAAPDAGLGVKQENGHGGLLSGGLGQKGETTGSH